MSRLFRGSFLFSLGILFSRILGYLRDAAIAYYFGASHISDAFFIAFRIPNTFRRIFGEGGFNAVFMPFYGEALKENREKDFLSKIFGLLLTFSFAITLIGISLSPFIISLLAPGIKEKETFHYAVDFLRFTFTYLLFATLYAFSMAILLVKGYFFIPSVSQAVFNLLFILSLIFFSGIFGAYALVLGVILGGIFQIIPNFALLLKENIFVKPKIVIDKEIKNFLKKFLLTVGSFSANQISLLVDTFLASFLKVGSISYIYYASRIYLLPISLFSISVSNTLLAVISSGEDKKKNINTALKIIFLFSIPASVGLFLLAEDVVNVLYLRGDFTKEDAYYTSKLLSLYSLTIPIYSLQHLFKSVFYSEKNVEIPVRATFLGVFVEGILGSTLIFILGMGVFSFPISALFASFIALLYLYVKLQKKPSLDFGNLFKVSFSSIIMGVSIFLAKKFIYSSVFLVFSIPLFMLIYFISLLLLKEEITGKLLSYGLFGGNKNS
ncbi:MAG: murein biosynthesis integral membrane protein MurJ [Aquifex sp.]|nr:MAG: murein biosynthesis integral membrane protein MurJ [Aquifex sp.]